MPASAPVSRCASDAVAVSWRYGEYVREMSRLISAFEAHLETGAEAGN